MNNLFKEATAKNADVREKNINNLYIYSSPNELLQLYNLHTPYMILLETCKEDCDNCLLYQFAPTVQISSHAKKENLKNRPSHQHSFIEIMYVLSGQITNHIENQTFSYNAGQCVVMNKNIHHREELEGDFRAVYFMFQDQYLQELIEEYKQTYTDMQLDIPPNPIYQLLENFSDSEKQFDKVYLDYFPKISASSVLKDLNLILNEITAETISHRPGSQFLVKGLFARFFEHLNDPASYSMRRIRYDSHGQEYLFGKIVHIMEATHGRTGRDELSRQLHYNGEYLNRIIKKYTGQTIKEYGKKLCLEEVCRQLVHTNKSISVILEDLRVSNRNHFYKLFQAEYGETPQQYRESHRIH